jgi:DNA-directed RNA polymerase sigma subunit (sigma70/sigma32)
MTGALIRTLPAHSIERPSHQFVKYPLLTEADVVSSRIRRIVNAETDLRRRVTRWRKAQEEVETARLAVREAIEQARDAGMTLDAIAKVVGVSRQRVLQILEK